jgi:hypothetical protein
VIVAGIIESGDSASLSGGIGRQLPPEPQLLCVGAGTDIRHLPDEIAECLLNDTAVEGLVRHLPGVQVETGQLGVVVEHFLKVGENTQYVFCAHRAASVG